MKKELFNSLKKCAAFLLCVIMTLCLFAATVSSADTVSVMTAQRKRSVYAETNNILGSAATGIYNSGDNISGSWVYDVPAEPDTHNLSAKLSSSEICGVGVTGNRTYFTFQPFAKISGGVDAFMVYMELPEYHKYGEQWSMRSLSFHMYEGDNSVSFWRTPVNMTVKYLANDATEWATTTVGSNGEYYLPGGFKGYIKMYFDTATDLASGQPLYDWMNSNGYNTSDGFILGTLQFDINYLGGSYGDIRIGGMYQVISDGDALTANLSDDSGAHPKVAKLNGTERSTPTGKATFYNRRANFDVYAGNAVTYDIFTPMNIDGSSITWIDPVSPGAKHPGIKLSRSEAIGKAYGVNSYFSSALWLTVNPGIDTFAMYVELPKYESGDAWSLQAASFGMSNLDGTINKWLVPANMRIAYLAKDGKEWKEGLTGSSGQFYLPSGFKGYVKCYMNTATTPDGSDFYKTLSDSGIDVENGFKINYFQFYLNRIGGDYGDFVLGGIYQMDTDGDSVYGTVNDWKYSSSDVLLTESLPTIEAERINGIYFDDTNYYEGAAVNDNIAKIWDLNWYSANGDPKSTIYWSAPIEPDTANAVIRAHSDTAEGQGMEIGPSNLIIHPNTIIHPDNNALMLYVELPKQGTPLIDGPGQWANYTVSLNAGTFYQNNSSAKFGRFNNMTVAYLEREDTEWKTSVCDGEKLVLPNGFKGYIKLYLDTAINNVSDGTTLYQHLENQGLDTSKEFRVADINMYFGWLGGKFGDMVVGGMYEINHDSDSIYADITDNGSSPKHTCLIFDTNSPETLAQRTQTLIELIAEVDITDNDLTLELDGILSRMTDEGFALLSDEEINVAESIVEQCSKYRPSFDGIYATESDDKTKVGITFNSVLDITAAKNSGYSVSEFGSVMLDKKHFTGIETFTDETVGAQLILSNDISCNTSSVSWESEFSTSNWSTHDETVYLRSFVTYTNGTNTITVWNKYTENNPYISASINDVYANSSLDVPTKPLYGDADLSGSINAYDIVVLRKQLLGFNAVADTVTSDVVHDTVLNIYDLIRIKKYLAGNNVLLGTENKDYFGFGDIKNGLTIEFDGTSSNSLALRTNPDRGWRLEAYVNVANTSDDNQTPQADPTFNVWNNLAKAPYQEFTPQLTQVYFYLTGYKETATLPQYAFDRMQAVFDKAEELGIKLVVRFAYQGDMTGIGEATDEIMLAHMKQLKPLLEKNKNLINVVEAGFLGSWGEWHSYGKTGIEHDVKALLEGIVEMVPEDLYIQIRYPQILDIIVESSPAYDDLGRIGIHNDSFFGYIYNPSAWPMNPAKEDGTWDETDEYNWNYALQKSAVTPTGGELFWAYEIDESQRVDAYDAILQYSMFRQNIFSLYHGYKEDHYDENGSAIYSMQDWEATALTTDWLDNNNVTYDPDYFADENGNAVTRNALEFITDHLGYRIALKKAEINSSFGAGDELNVDLDLVNYGFSAAYNMQSGFAILDNNGNVISEINSGTPSTWNSRNALDWNDGALLNHHITASLTLPEAAGSYKLAFVLKNSAGTGAQLASSLEYIEGGYTVISDIEVAAPHTLSMDIFDFSEGKDLYGEKAINVLGDSITQGLDSTRHYDESWLSIFKNSLNDSLGTYNLGYVSLNCKNANGDLIEINDINPITSGWVRKCGWEEGSMPGNFSYVANSSAEEIFEFSLNRRADDVNRHINGFYVHFTAGPEYYEFNVNINGNYAATVNCNADTLNACARSQYIAIPDGYNDEITIQIIKPASTNSSMVKIGGISYRQYESNAVTVNNYALSGIRLCEYSDELIRNLAKANAVICTLGTNDAGTNVDINIFKHKLDVLVEACLANGTPLIIGDVIWARYGDDGWASPYQNALYAASVRANGYYVDFTEIPQVLQGADDICHPSVKGHSLMGEYFCRLLGLNNK